MSRRNKVFISYSHKDGEYLDELRPFLESFDDDKALVFHDRKLGPGVWQEQIDKALAETKVAVPLVSQNFLASDFIQDREIPKLLEGTEEDDPVVIIPLFLSPSRSAEYLSRFSAPPPNKPDRTLAEMDVPQRQRTFTRLAEEIGKILPPKALALYCAADEEEVEPVLGHLEQKGLAVERQTWPETGWTASAQEAARLQRDLAGNRSAVLVVTKRGLGPWSDERLKRILADKAVNRYTPPVMVAVLVERVGPELGEQIPDEIPNSYRVRVKRGGDSKKGLETLYLGLSGERAGARKSLEPPARPDPPPSTKDNDSTRRKQDRSQAAVPDWSGQINSLRPDLEKGDLTIFLGQGVVEPEQRANTHPRRWELTQKLLEDLFAREEEQPQNLSVLPPFNHVSSFFAVREGPKNVQDYVRSKFACVAVPAIHRKVAKLMGAMGQKTSRGNSERLIVTTNFDTLMERALLAKEVAFTRIVQHWSGRRIEVNEYTKVEKVGKTSVRITTKAGEQQTVDLDVEGATKVLVTNAEQEKGADLEEEEIAKLSRQAEDALNEELLNLGRETITPKSRSRRNRLEMLPVRDYTHPLLYKFHGSHDVRDSCALTAEQYLRLVVAARKDGIIPNQLKNYIQRGPALFLGYGLLDPEFKVTLYTLLESEQGEDEPLRFAVQLPPAEEPADPNRVMERPIWQQIKDRTPRGIRVVEGDIGRFVDRVIEAV